MEIKGFLEDGNERTQSSLSLIRNDRNKYNSELRNKNVKSLFATLSDNIYKRLDVESEELSAWILKLDIQQTNKKSV